MSWPLVKLDSAITFIRGITFKPEDLIEPFSEGSVVVMRTKNVQVAGLAVDDLIAVPRPFMRREEQQLRCGDLLISSANSWELVGKASYVDNLEYEATAGGFISIVRPKAEVIDSRYLYHWVMSPKNQHAIRHCGRQTTNISNLDVGRFKELEIPLPPLKEQKRIAAILDKADNLRRKRQQAIQLADEFLRAVFLDMFGDPVTNPMGWETYRFGDVVETQLGKMLSKKAKEGLAPKKYLRNANVRWRELELGDLLEMDFNEKEIKKFELKYGDLLVCEGGEVGRCAIWREQVEDCFYQKALHRVRPEKSKLTPEYLQEYFYWMSRCGGLSDSVSEVTFSHLTAEKLKELTVPVPPIPVQEEFVKKYSAIEKLKNRNMLVSNVNKECFSSISKAAFSGKL